MPVLRKGSQGIPPPVANDLAGRSGHHAVPRRIRSRNPDGSERPQEFKISTIPRAEHDRAARSGMVGLDHQHEFGDEIAQRLASQRVPKGETAPASVVRLFFVGQCRETCPRRQLLVPVRRAEVGGTSSANVRQDRGCSPIPRSASPVSMTIRSTASILRTCSGECSSKSVRPMKSTRL